MTDLPPPDGHRPDPDDRDPDDRNPRDRRPVAPGPKGSVKASAFAALDPRLAGVAAGLASAVLTGAVVVGLPFGTALYFFAALPVLFVGFSHGPLAAVVAAAVGALAMGVVAGPLAALTAAATAGVPAAYAAYLVGLARPADELGGPADGMAWYPLADVLLRVCLTVAAGSVAIGVAVGYGTETIGALLAEAVGDQPLDPELAAQGLTPEAIATYVTALVPIAQPFGAVLVIVGNLYLAIGAARRRGLIGRPADDMALALRLPTVALPIFGVALALSFLDGPVAYAARAFAGALAAGFTIAGYAILHLRLRGSTARTPILLAVYLGTAIFSLPAFVMLGMGLFSTARAVPISKRKT